jgi:hypothetical protein
MITMNNIKFKLAEKILRVAFMVTLCSTSLASAQTNNEKLNPQELAAVIGEIKEMIKTDENLVDSFVVKEATPERVRSAAYQHTRERANLCGQKQVVKFRQTI